MLAFEWVRYYESNDVLHLVISFALRYRFLCVAIVVCFDIYLWLNDTIIYPIFYVLNLTHCIDVFTPAYIFEIAIAITAILLQLSLRLYLRFVKKIQS